MTREEAIRLLDPKTTTDALADIEYYAGFSGKKACIKAIEDACVLAVEALKKQIAKPPNIIDWSGVCYDRLVEFDCPGCCSPIEYLDDHCECCGQAIEWEADKQ